MALLLGAATLLPSQPRLLCPKQKGTIPHFLHPRSPTLGSVAASSSPAGNQPRHSQCLPAQVLPGDTGVSSQLGQLASGPPRLWLSALPPLHHSERSGCRVCSGLSLGTPAAAQRGSATGLALSGCAAQWATESSPAPPVGGYTVSGSDLPDRPWI